MKTIALAVVMPSLILSGWALAAQETEQKKDPSMMEHMMKEGEGEEDSARHDAHDEDDGSVQQDDGVIARL
jgi:hypothetical protein